MTQENSQPSPGSLRSVDLTVPDLEQARSFFVDTWGLSLAARDERTLYLRGTGADHHVLSIRVGEQAALRHITFRADSAATLDQLSARCVAQGGVVLAPRAPLNEPGGGESVLIRDRQGRNIRLVCGDERQRVQSTERDRPSRLAHVVLNSVDVAGGQTFFEQGLGLHLSDRTRIMAFLRIPAREKGDHHSIALADADNNCLNHIAFEMPGLDDVMRGGGRLKDAGYPIEWGPGRHGPGDNLFNYFVGPFDFVIEYTAEVEQVGDDYPVHGPDYWKWPAGRFDHWGVSAAPSDRLKRAQKAIHFCTPEQL